MSEPAFTPVLRQDALPHAAKAEVEVGGRSVLLCNWNGRVFAVSNICSHADQTLYPGKMANGWIACPVHGARFDLATGKAKNPPAVRPIATYAVRIVDDMIEVAV